MLQSGVALAVAQTATLVLWRAEMEFIDAKGATGQSSGLSPSAIAVADSFHLRSLRLSAARHPTQDVRPHSSARLEASGR